MKWQVATETGDWQLETRRQNEQVDYTFTGDETFAGRASVVEIEPGHYSILLPNGISIDVQLIRESGGPLEALAGSSRYLLSLADMRDFVSGTGNGLRHGPAEVRALMPGKIIKILVEPGQSVTAGDALLVIEAMKMQNEMKSPRDGTVVRVATAEGSTAAANEVLLVIE